MTKGGQRVLSVTQKKQDLLSNELKDRQQCKHLEKVDIEKVSKNCITKSSKRILKQELKSAIRITLTTTPCPSASVAIQFCTGDLNWGFPEQISRSFPLPIKLNKYRVSIKRIVTLLNPNARKVSHYSTLLENSQTFIFTCLCPNFQVKVQCFSVFCVRVLRVAAVALFQRAREVSFFLV